MSKKGAAVLLLIFGVLFLLGGAVAGGAAKEHQGVNASTGYIDSSGKLVITDSGVIGRNDNAISFYTTIKHIMIFAGVCCSGAACILFFQMAFLQMAPSFQKTGIIENVDPSSGRVAVRGEDGSIHYFSKAPNIFLIPGDTGRFEIKRNTIVGYGK